MIQVKTYDPPRINEKEILRYAGVRDKNADVENIKALLSECLAELDGKLSYRVCYTEFNVRKENGEMDLGFVKVRSNSLEKNLKDSREIILFAATVGIEIDRFISRYSVISPSKAYMFQAIGAERIEALCNAFCDDMAAEKARQNKVISNRFSVGYGDLSLSLQRDIFLVLGCEKNIGLTLNDCLLMSPSKSVTAIIGVLPKE